MLPARYYFPADAVQLPLIPSRTRTVCPYKGRASYWSLDLSGRTHRDLAWTYPEPFIDASPLQGYVCFFDERTDLVLDGSLQPRLQLRGASGPARSPGARRGPPRAYHWAQNAVMRAMSARVPP